MNDSDPRPMPPTVLAAYRDPLVLSAVLDSWVFSDAEAIAVRDELLERLVAKHGKVEVEQKGRLVPIRRRVSKFKKRAWDSIKIMISAEEYGGRQEIMLELAKIMQPYWLRGWSSHVFRDYFSAQRFLSVSSYVMGPRQLTWIAAQYARSVVGLVRRSSAQDAAIKAIEAAEEWSIYPSPDNRKKSGERSAQVYQSVYDLPYEEQPSRLAALSACDAATVTDSESGKSALYALTQAGSAVAALEDLPASARHYSKMSELTKQLITPTLVTHASGALR